MFIIMQRCFQSGILLRKHIHDRLKKEREFVCSFISSRRYTPGGEVALPVIVNACVHVIMYLYYALSIMHIQRKLLARVKLFVTVIQVGVSS